MTLSHHTCQRTAASRASRRQLQHTAPTQPSADRVARGLSYNCRETVFPDGVIDAWDAPMPPALIRFALTGVGYLAGADKADVYTGNTNQFYDSNIPAEPWIAPCNADGECYQWNSYGAAGGKDGPYHFWTDFASHGPVVVSCAREVAADSSATTRLSTMATTTRARSKFGSTSFDVLRLQADQGLHRQPRRSDDMDQR